MTVLELLTAEEVRRGGHDLCNYRTSLCPARPPEGSVPSPETKEVDPSLSLESLHVLDGG